MFKKILPATAIILLVIYVGGAWFFSNIVIHFKHRTLADDRLHVEYESVADAGLPEPENVSIQAGSPADGSQDRTFEVRGWYFANPAGNDCAVVAQHGHGSTRWGVLKYAPLFWKYGCSILSVDARYHGESDGTCGTYGYHERYDLQRVIAWLQSKTGLPKNKIGLLGESMGASIAIMTAALEPELAFLAADSSYRDLHAVVYERGVREYGAALINVMLPGTILLANWRCSFALDEVSPEKYAASLKMPVFVSHSAADKDTLPYHSEEIFRSVAHERKVLYINKWDARHARDINVNYAGYERHMDDFLERFAPDFGR
jgi:hypothetical protein